ncbi:MAG: GFA family protein [Alphaproteobacteria bacterium]
MTDSSEGPHRGGCACGVIRYSFEGAPRYMGNCHCRDCQQATGSAYFPGVGVKANAFVLERGEPAWFDRMADRGHTVSRAFCRDCGSPVYLRNGATPGFVAIYAGSLDDPSWYRPALDIFTKSAQPWDQMDPALPKAEAMPSKGG